MDYQYAHKHDQQMKLLPITWSDVFRYDVAENAKWETCTKHHKQTVGTRERFHSHSLLMALDDFITFAEVQHEGRIFPHLHHIDEKAVAAELQEFRNWWNEANEELLTKQVFACNFVRISTLSHCITETRSQIPQRRLRQRASFGSL